MNKEQGITEAGLTVIHSAICLLPETVSAAYKEACEKAPELVVKESNHAWFLR
jgi:hypothetical protein